MNYVGIFMVHVKQIDFIGQDAAIETALFHHGGMKPVGIGIHDGGADAAAGALPAYDQRLHPAPRQVGDQRRSKERTRPFLVYDQVVRLGPELLPDVVGIAHDPIDLAVSRCHVVWIDFLAGFDRRVKKRKSRCPGGLTTKDIVTARSAGLWSLAVDRYATAVLM